MHSQLRQADIHRVQGHLGVCDVAQSRTTGHIRTVGVLLHRHPHPLAHQAEDGGGYRVGGVLLIGVILDDDAAVHIDGVVSVPVLRVVGVDGVGIVAGHQEAVGYMAAVGFPVRPADAAEHIIKKGRGRALLGLAAYLLVVKETIDRHTAALLRRQKSSKSTESALQIVQPGGGNKSAPRLAPLGIVNEQVCGENILLCRAHTGGHTGPKGPLSGPV